MRNAPSMRQERMKVTIALTRSACGGRGVLRIALPGTIRGDYALEIGFNIVHGSDGPETAKQEISLFFKPEELVDYGLVTAQWVHE